jgi:hypothetical protein
MPSFSAFRSEGERPLLLRAGSFRAEVWPQTLRMLRAPAVVSTAQGRIGRWGDVLPFVAPGAELVYDDPPLAGAVGLLLDGDGEPVDRPLRPTLLGGAALDGGHELLLLHAPDLGPGVLVKVLD